jgi:hypothetical protein
VHQKKYVTGHNRVFYSEVADYALTLIKNMVTNNAEVHKNPLKELITWACDTAELAWEELLNRGWAHEALKRRIQVNMTRDPRRWVRWPADHPAAGSTWERECCTATVTPAFNGDTEQIAEAQLRANEQIALTRQYPGRHPRGNE